MTRSILVLFSLLSTSAFADVLDQLDFGTIVVARNDRVSTLKLPTNSAMSSSNDIHIMERGHPARLFFEALPANTLISFSSSSVNVELGSRPAVFTISQLLFRPTAQTNAYGEIELVIGAILQTSGDGAVYNDGEYQGSVSIELSY